MSSLVAIIISVISIIIIILIIIPIIILHFRRKRKSPIGAAPEHRSEEESRRRWVERERREEEENRRKLEELAALKDTLKEKEKNIYYRVRYWRKMQKGKEYPFIIFITKMKKLLNAINQSHKKYEIITEIGNTTLPQKAIKGFYVRVSSPAMEIYPTTKKVILDADKLKKILHKIEFKIVPNYCSKFDIKLEFIYDDITFYEESFKSKIQKSGFKIKKLQISGSLVGFFSLFITLGTFIQPFLPFDIINFLFYYGLVVFFAFLGFLIYNLGIGNNLIQIVRVEFSPTISSRIEF